MIIDLQSARATRDAPDPDCASHDSLGRPMYLYGVEYWMDDRLWALTLEAYSLEDAERRVGAIHQGLIYGQIYRSTC